MFASSCAIWYYAKCFPIMHNKIMGMVPKVKGVISTPDEAGDSVIHMGLSYPHRSIGFTVLGELQ